METIIMRIFGLFKPRNPKNTQRNVDLPGRSGVVVLLGGALFSVSELTDILASFCLPLPGRKLVTKARDESPVRKVGSSSGIQGDPKKVLMSAFVAISHDLNSLVVDWAANHAL